MFAYQSICVWFRGRKIWFEEELFICVCQFRERERVSLERERERVSLGGERDGLGKRVCT